MEDNLKPDETFSPSIFDQAKEFYTPSKNNDETSSTLSPFDKPKHDIKIDEATAKTLVEIPFDIASYLTKVNDVKLIESEAVKLGSLWRAPLERILSQYENSDIAIAALATLGIATEKYLEYQLSVERRNSTRDEGKGKDELRKE
jgi:hypothetical protein